MPLIRPRRLLDPWESCHNQRPLFTLFQDLPRNEGEEVETRGRQLYNDAVN